MDKVASTRWPEDASFARSPCGESRSDSRITVTVRCFGEFRLSGADGFTDAPVAKRGRELLQYLVLRPHQSVSRARLCESFWPDADEDAVAHRLHIAASGARSYLRALLDGFDAIRCTADGYAWNPAVHVSSDVRLFVELYESESPTSHKRAITLYGGELFEGETADWLQPARVKYAAMYTSMVEGLATTAFDDRSFEAALYYGLELLAIDRAHEGASRLVMRSFGALGRRAPAMAEYEALRTHLKKYLAVEPMLETQRVIEAIMKGESPADR